MLLLLAGAAVVVAVQGLVSKWLHSTTRRARRLRRAVDAKNAKHAGSSPSDHAEPGGVVVAYQLAWDVGDSASATSGLSEPESRGGWFSVSLVQDGGALALDADVRAGRVNAGMLAGAPVLLRAADPRVLKDGSLRTVVMARYAAVQGRVFMPIACADLSVKARPDVYEGGGGGIASATLLAFDHAGGMASS